MNPDLAGQYFTNPSGSVTFAVERETRVIFQKRVLSILLYRGTLRDIVTRFSLMVMTLQSTEWWRRKSRLWLWGIKGRNNLLHPNSQSDFRIRIRTRSGFNGLSILIRTGNLDPDPSNQNGLQKKEIWNKFRVERDRWRLLLFRCARMALFKRNFCLTVISVQFFCHKNLSRETGSTPIPKS